MKKFLYLAVVGLIIAGAAYLYVFQKPHTDFTKISADTTISSDSLFNAFQQDQTFAEQTYIAKAEVIEVEGIISEIRENIILLSTNYGGTISCNMIEMDAQFEVGQSVTIKGRVTAYDDLIYNEVQMDNCSID